MVRRPARIMIRWMLATTHRIEAPDSRRTPPAWQVGIICADWSAVETGKYRSEGSIVAAVSIEFDSDHPTPKAPRPGGILAPAHRGVTHVRGKDCVHPDIGLVVVQDDLFSCPGERTTGA